MPFLTLLGIYTNISIYKILRYILRLRVNEHVTVVKTTLYLQLNIGK